jgi:exonuclease SbcD
VHYSGAPLQVDFGEQDNSGVVCLVEAAPGLPAKVTDIPITAGRRLRTVRGSVEELAALATQDASLADGLLRVWVREPARAGLRERVLEALPSALEVRIDPEFAASAAGSRPSTPDGVERRPEELFAEYCAAQGVADDRVRALFARLHDEVTGQ